MLVDGVHVSLTIDTQQTHKECTCSGEFYFNIYQGVCLFTMLSTSLYYVYSSICDYSSSAPEDFSGCGKEYYELNLSR